MTNIQKYLFTSLATLGFLSIVKPALAEETVNGSDLQKVMAQTTALESQIKLLKTEIRQLKHEQNTFRKVQNTQSVQKARPAAQTQISAPESAQNNASFPSLSNYLTGTPIVIAPYAGGHREFNASDLIINYSSYNEDLRLLQLRQKIYQNLKPADPSQTSSFLLFSGKIEGLGFYQKSSGDTSSSGISLEDSELDIMPVLNEWASGYMAFNYSQGAEPADNPVVSNSTRVHISKAFLTLGNLNQFPLYATMGQIDVPFGAYSNSMVSSTLPNLLFKTRAQALLLGYSSPSGEGVYAQTYIFNGDTNTNRSNNIDDIGANAGFKFSQNGWNAGVGAGVINNVADSLGMQNTGAGGFSVATIDNQSPEKLHRQVPGVDVHADIGTGPFSLNSEYIRSTSAFNIKDMSYNGDAAQPQALDVQGSYSFHLFEKPAAVSAGFGKTWDAAALMAPEKRYIAAFTTSIWKDTIQEIEYCHDINYASSDNGSIAGMGVSGTGDSKNTIAAQIGIYF